MLCPTLQAPRAARTQSVAWWSTSWHRWQNLPTEVELRTAEAVSDGLIAFLATPGEDGAWARKVWS